MIPELTIEEIAVMIETAQSIDRARKDKLLDKLEEETAESDSTGTVLSDGLLKDLTVLFEKEMKHIEEEKLPNEEALLETVEAEYDEEMNQAKPHLIELIDEYEHETALLMEQNKKDYVELDKELDEFLQEHKNKSEEAEIASIKQKLVSKTSSDN